MDVSGRRDDMCKEDPALYQNISMQDVTIDGKGLATSNNRLKFVTMAAGPRTQHDNKSLRA